MGRFSRAMLLAMAALAAPAMAPASAVAPEGVQRPFRTAIYITVRDTIALADPAVFAHRFARAQAQVHFDKVYLEVYRDHLFATDAQIDSVKRAFAAKGITVAGGITLAAGGKGGQFGTFDYEDDADRAECVKAVKLAAKHYDEVILDDFFFYTSKSDADIAAKGKRSWTQYRLDTMRQVSRELVIAPAKAVNPKVRVIIKYPNWYEHFQGLGYDLDKQPGMFDGIYTGTETRDPVITDQQLQQYESYSIVRYFSNIAPGRNGGGWVDTYDVHAADRYAEQLWDTVFAKAGEITLFNWAPLSDDKPIDGGERPWAGKDTSFDWNRIATEWRQSHPGEPAAGWGAAAGAALDIAAPVVAKLGNPIGIASYKPYQSSGEDFLHNYLGNAGIPIELSPQFPETASTILLTQSAAADPQIVDRIKRALTAGKTVVVTSGLVAALQDRGFHDLAEWTPTGRVAAIADFFDGYGAGKGERLSTDSQSAVLFPEFRFYTNDSWGIIRGVASAKGYPIVLMNRYSAGTLMMLTIPENQGDLYALPQAMMTRIKRYVMADFPAYLDAPAKVSMYAYDNRTIIVQNFRDDTVSATLIVKGTGVRATPLLGGPALSGEQAGDHSRIAMKLAAHSFIAISLDQGQ